MSRTSRPIGGPAQRGQRAERPCFVGLDRPRVVVRRRAREDEAIALANNTEFGLAATLVCGDRARAERISEHLVAGTIWVNCFFVRDLRAPFGGSRKSGIGREGGVWSFDFYADVKNTVFSPNGWR